VKYGENSNHMTNVIDLKSEQALARDFDARAKISAALACLRDAHDQASGLQSIREVVANVLGSEEVAVFKLDKEMAVLWLYWCVGIDPNRCICLDVISEPKLESVLAGEIIVASGRSDEKLLSLEDPVSALVPIFVHDTVAAVIVIFRLLPQKTAFDAADHDVCRALSTHASQAIQPIANIRHSKMKRDDNK
jgi:GAF domain-containing protein